MRLLKITLTNFQGIKALTLEPLGVSASIYGDNATGKTTIYNALTWLLFDKSSTGAKNFTPKTRGPEGDIHHLEHKVEAKAKALRLTRQQASVLASIVKAESNNEAEMPKIAGVYLNRLKIGMPLQADPTIAFCYDYQLSRILLKHLEVDSAYNTYTHTGLPPGPICVPTRAALEAVLNPDFGGTWGAGNLYFCANSDFSGTHVFAKTLAEHNRNAAAFQAELTRRGRK